ncbi:MAG: ABC transporter permease subunit [Spirochaetaceae bacterium]|jgi:putative aldouronate transport system permease protein|nr:ABC transporter permease subunit [Spirochaetaceae bacterium]
MAEKKQGLRYRIRESRYIYILLLPGLVYFILFKYAPMWMLVIAFQDYNPWVGISGSQWVGLKHFFYLLKDPMFYLMLRNTLAINMMSLVFFFPLPIIWAILLNEVRHSGFKRINQTIFYFPHFLSWVIVASLTYFLLSIDVGIINKLLIFIGLQPVSFLSNPGFFWIILTLQDIWKESGWGTIIFLAAIAMVDVEQYEAAIIDGAGRFKRIWHITIPAIMPTVVVLLLLRLGNIATVGFEQVLLMMNPLVNNVAEVFDTYAYRLGILQSNISFGTAVNVFKGIVGLIFVWVSNRSVKKLGYEGIY